MCALSVGLRASAQPSAQSTAGPAPVVVSGKCPESSAVEKLLSTLLPARAPAATPVEVTVSDLGDTYLVAAGARAKTYTDPSRDCAERARVASAFIAHALAPEAPPALSASPPPPPRPPAPPPPVPAPPLSDLTPRRWVRVDTRGAIGVAPQDGLVAPGAELGVTAGWIASGWTLLGGHAMCGWSSGATMDISAGGAGVLIERFPCAVGPMVRLFPGARGGGEGRLEVDVDPGLALGAGVVSGRGLTTTFQSARLEIGARLALDAAWHFGAPRAGWGPVLGVEATYYPAPYDLDVTPRGTVARTPTVWAGFTAGVCWTVE